MHLDRLRLGEIVTAIGAIGVFASLFFDWVRPSGAVLRAQSGFAGLGIVIVALLVLTVLVGMTLVVLTVSVEPVGLTVGMASTTAAVGILTTVVLLIRLTLAQPDLGLGDSQVDLLGPAYVGLACCAATAAGGWLTLRDERTDAPYSTAPDLPPRPLPPLSPL